MNFKDPVRPINQELLNGLDVIDNSVYPLPGAVGKRIGEVDSRLSGLNSINTKDSDKIVWYEHLATVHHKPTGVYYVAFKETMDALMARQSDLEKYPEWLIKSDVKKTELHIHIYSVVRHPKRVPGGWPEHITDWLAPVESDSVIDAIAYFLLQKRVITQEMYSR